MRSYPHDSPQAAARIVTLAMLADGAVSGAEIDALDRSGVHQQLGLWRAFACDERASSGVMSGHD